MFDHVAMLSKLVERFDPEQYRVREDISGVSQKIEDDDEYPRKPRLFWVRHGHYRGLTYSRQNSKPCKLLTASEMLPVTMGSTRTK